VIGALFPLVRRLRAPACHLLAVVGLASLTPGMAAAAQDASEMWLKAVVFDPQARVARYLPEHAIRADVSYSALRPEIAALVAPLAAQLAGMWPPGPGLPDTLSVSFGQFPETGAGSIGDAEMRLAEVRTYLGACTSAAPESLGENGGDTFVLVRLRCANARGPEWRNPFLAFTVTAGATRKVTINIGDLPNIRVAARGTTNG